MTYQKLIILADKTTPANAVKTAIAIGLKLRTGAKDENQNYLKFDSGSMLVLFDGEICDLDVLADIEELKGIVQMPLIAVQGNYSMDGWRLANHVVFCPSDMPKDRVDALVESGILGKDPFVMPYDVSAA